MAEETVTQKDIDEVEETPTDDVVEKTETSDDIDTKQTVDETPAEVVDETSNTDMDMVQLEQRITSLEQRLLSIETTPEPQPEPQPQPDPELKEDDGSDVDEIEDVLDL